MKLANFLAQTSLMTLICLSLLGCSTVTVTRMNDVRLIKNQIYKTADGQALNGDIYIPKTEGLKPAVLVVHGGSWASRSGDMHQISEDLSASGFVVYNITYRLAPAALYPKALEDVSDAVRYLREHSSELEIDPNKISAWGYSAGSQLVLMMGLDPAMHIQSIVAGGTPADFSMWPISPVIEKYIGKPYSQAKAEWEDASPVNHVVANSPPVFMYHGQNDHIVEPEQMERMKLALQNKGVEVKTYLVPVLGHIFVYEFSEKSIKLGIDFIRNHLGLK